MTDDIHSFQDTQPTQNFYWVTHNDDGKAIYYETSMDEYYTYRALYGLPQFTTWTYTNHQADQTHKL